VQAVAADHRQLDLRWIRSICRYSLRSVDFSLNWVLLLTGFYHIMHIVKTYRCMACITSLLSMYVCMYVCMCNVCLCMYTCIRQLSIYSYVMYVCACVCMSIDMCVSMHAHHMHTPPHTHTHTCMHACIGRSQQPKQIYNIPSSKQKNKANKKFVLKN
jgi:hypothetical protein